MADFYTPQELARKAGVSDRYITRLCRNGTITATKPSRDWIISKEAGDKWLEERRKPQK